MNDPTIFLTGGSGFIGRRLLHRLKLEGYRVRALVRSKRSRDIVESLGAQAVMGDLLDYDSFNKAADGCQVIFHLAGLFSLGLFDKRKLWAANVKGTENIVRLTAEMNIPKLIYCGSTAALGGSDGKPLTEGVKHKGDFMSVYEETKFVAHEKILQFAKKREGVIVALPTLVMGPGGDDLLGIYIKSYSEGGLPFLINMNKPISYVYVDDVAEGLHLCFKNGKSNQQYIFASESCSIIELVDLLERYSGRERPRILLSPSASKPFVYVNELISTLVRRHPPVTIKSMISLSQRSWVFSGQKAKEELGWRPLGLKEMVKITLSHINTLPDSVKSVPYRGKHYHAAPRENLLKSEKRMHKRILVPDPLSANVIDPSDSTCVTPAKLETLSVNGMSLSSETIFPNTSEFTIQLVLPDTNKAIETTACKIWELVGESGKKRYGLHLSALRSFDHKTIKAFIDRHIQDGHSTGERRMVNRRNDIAIQPEVERQRSDRRWSLPTYFLSIGGRDVDTGNYDYLPYADMLISDPKATQEVILSLKKGDYPSNTADYVYGRYCVGDLTHSQLAIEAASNAFPVFSRFPLSKRLSLYRHIEDLLFTHKENLIHLMVAEGHPRKLAEWQFSGMLYGAISETFAFYRTEVIKLIGTRDVETTMLVRKPDGVICLSPPRNAPASNSLTAALSFLGGNTLIVKPPLTMPASTIYLWKHVIGEALRLIGAPAGVLSIVVGNTIALINHWISNPIVNDIIYFGDSDRGIELGKRMYAAGKKPILELSGKDILLIWQDADLESAADSLVDCFLGSTQICMVPKMALIHGGIYDQFCKIFIQKVKALKVGLPSDPDSCLSPVGRIDDFMKFKEDASMRGGILLYGGERLNFKGILDKKGPFLQPTVVGLDDRPDLRDFRCVREENFFPLLPLIKVTGRSEGSNMSSGESATKNLIYGKMLSIINQNEYGLRVSVWCRSNSLIRRFVRDIHNCGLLRINCRHVGFSMYLASHGGTGKTGGPFGELNYIWQKTTHLQGVAIKV